VWSCCGLYIHIMLIRTKSLLSIIVLTAAMSSSCGNKDAGSSGSAPADSSTPAPPPPLPAGISQNLTHTDGAPFYTFDSLGPIQFPAVQKSNQISGDASNAISGWALEVSKKGPAGAVDIVIDQTPYSAQYGLGRSDVATHFNRPDYAKCGFQLVLAPRQLSKGPHTVSVRVISSDKKSYNEGPVVQFTVN
jgi:hypothetical protein